jgi:hypothetical protein
MYEQRRFPRLAWVSIAAGVLWFWIAADHGLLTIVLTLPAGGLLLAAGIAHLLWPGDVRITQTMALGGLLAVLGGLPMMFVAGAASGLALAAAGAASLLAAGGAAVYVEPWLPGVPKPSPGLGLAARVAADEVVLGLEQFSVGLPIGHDLQRLVGEILEAHSLFGERGWIGEPTRYHTPPPVLTKPQIRSAHSGRIAFEHLSYESEYAPHPDEPGRERWLGYRPNRTAHAWVLRHRDGDRPWLVCSNGYRSGNPGLDLRLFGYYHETLGLNVLMPVLPLHGPRRVGRLSGDGFLGGEVLDSIHAEAQAIWDLRRLIGWIRAEGAPRVGALGLSLGGFTTALLAGIESGLASAVAGIAIADLARIFWRHGPKLQLAYLAHAKIDEALVSTLMRPVSPLAVLPLVPQAGRMLFGGISDRLVPPDHIRDLSAHWEHPRTVWYAGGHLSFWLDPRVQAGIDATLLDSQLTR